METKKLWETIQNKRLDELVVELEKLKEQDRYGRIYIEEVDKNGRSKIASR